MRCISSVALAVSLCLSIGTLSRATVVHDDFETDSSANYTILDDGNAPSGLGTADSTSDFSFDYVGAGIPLAPNSAAGDRGGLRFAVNETDDPNTTTAEEDHITAFHNTVVNRSSYSLQVDMYMGVEAAGGTTEFAHIGVAGDGTDFNSIFTPIAGSGHFISITGEGGSSSDYRHFVPSVTSVPSGDASYLNSTNTTNATGDTYQALFPSPPAQFAGSPGNLWTTLKIIVRPGTVTYLLDGTPIIRATTEVTNGRVSLGYTDPFDSVGPHFVIYDNLWVVPEPGSIVLATLMAIGAMLVRRRR